MPRLKSNTTEALYEQLLVHFRTQILNGTLSAGEKLPSEPDIVEEFGVSRGTVRQALGILVNEGLVERVHGSGTYVRELPVSPSSVEHSYTNGIVRNQVGLVLSRQDDQFNMEILIGVEQGARSRGYQVTFTYGEENINQQSRNIARLLENNIAGLIIFPVGKNAEQEGITTLIARDIPFVLVDRYFPDLNTDWVIADNESGGYRATEHLLILGHHRIGFTYGGPASSLQVTSIRDRWLGYRRALEHYGLAYDERLVFQRNQKADALQEYEKYLQVTERPNAVFAVNDLEALALMKAAQRLGMRVPQELALVGFDDLSFSEHLAPPLTTIYQPRKDLGLRAINLLLDRIEGIRLPPEHVELPTNLIIRESCGAKLHIKRSLTL